MRRYRLDPAGRLHTAAGNQGNVFLLTPEELPRCPGLPHRRALAAALENIRYCRAAAYRDCVQGTIRLPTGGMPLRFCFCLNDAELYLIPAPESPAPLTPALPAAAPATPAGVLLALLEQHMGADALVLQTLEKRLNALEEALAAGHIRGFESTVMAERRTLAALHGAYAQLVLLGDELQADAPRMLNRAERAAWQRATTRAARLRDEAETLREYILQLWQVYQSRIELEQNRVVTMLTVVTTLFLPLSLIVGWYGMNFDGMLAPNVPWGYPTVGAVCALVLGAGLLFFRRKGML
ncbi:hypothetical protein H6B15_09310 [Gemmiger formicilis]|uniref:CorA family divalent cation transporter n=1 Tax=Gemmiger formicilis TaxID=745368 RepID=UPI00195939DE|nr:CorA family divalent cation transporter [Gemmiger formicilis]MBM6716856.1 hypothetical protein [Gemmiger formicilis]